MPAYPVDQGGVGSKIRVDPDAGIQITPMEDGEIRGFTDYTEEQFRITVEHFWLDSTNRDALFTFYSTNKTTLNSIVTDEGTFDFYFLNRPRVVDKEGPNYLVVSNLIGVLQ